MQIKVGRIAALVAAAALSVGAASANAIQGGGKHRCPHGIREVTGMWANRYTSCATALRVQHAWLRSAPGRPFYAADRTWKCHVISRDQHGVKIGVYVNVACISPGARPGAVTIREYGI